MRNEERIIGGWMMKGRRQKAAAWKDEKSDNAN